jgi:type IV pilus secretin PilQ/predicted competence protein
MKTRSVRFRIPRQGPGSGAMGKNALLCFMMLAFSAHGAEQKPPNALQQPKLPGTVQLPGMLQNGKIDKIVKLSPSGALMNVTTSQENNSLVISVATSGLVEHKEFSLQNPPRLVVDFLNVDCKVPFFQLPINSAPVRQVRIRQFQESNPKIARLAFDLDDENSHHEILTDDHSVRIVFHSSTHPDGLDSSAVDSAHAQTPVPGSQKLKAAAPPHKPSNATAQPGSGIVSAPVIQDLAISEIPRSALAAAQPLLQQPRPAEPVPPANHPAQAPPPPPIVPSPATAAAPNQESRSAGQPLTLDLVDIPLIDFFRLMAEEGGINIVMDPEIKGTISIKVVKVPWDQIFEAALLNNGLDKKVEGNLVRIARKATLQEEAKQQENLKKANMLAADLETRIKRLNYAKATAFVVTLQDLKTVRGTVVVDERTNSLVLTDLPSSLLKMIQLIESLDIPQPQVEIEARIVSATRDFARDIGIQFGFVQGNLDRVTLGGPNTFGSIGGTRPSTTPTNTYAAGNPQTGRGASQNTATQSGAVSTGMSTNNAGNWNVNMPSQTAFGGLGISVGNLFDTFLLDAAITAGESKGLAKLISQPKVTAQNNSPAMITQGLRFPVQIIANNTITVQFQNAALTLTVTPQITYEGNIVMDLKVENNTPDFSRQVNGIPSIRTSESNTRVLVSDGGTTVIAGILIDNESTTEDRVPGLASLPIVGNLFRRSAVSHSTQEVLFFITPRIIK